MRTHFVRTTAAEREGDQGYDVATRDPRRDQRASYPTWMVVMHTNVNIHISAIGRYEDKLVKRDGKWLILERRRTE